MIKCGGRVFPAQEDPDVNRIWMPESNCPGLAMTRAFGDFCLKDYGLSSVPEMFYRKLSKQDEFVVLATDGVSILGLLTHKIAAKSLINVFFIGMECTIKQ